MKKEKRGLRGEVTACAAATASGVESVFGFIFQIAFEGFEDGFVEGGFADDVFFAGPVAEIVGAAALAAKRKLGVSFGVRRLAADGTGTLHGGLPGTQYREEIVFGRCGGAHDGRRGEFDGAGDEVIFFRLGDFNGGERAGSGQISGVIDAFEIGDVDLAVNFGRHAFEARFPDEVGIFRRTFEQDLKALADALLQFARGNFLLDGHELIAAALNGLGVNFIFEMKTFRGVFVGIGENAHPIEFGGANEIAKLLEIGFGFAGEADDKRCANRDAGDDPANFFEHFEKCAGVRAALHAGEDAAAGVLERHVEIFGEARVRGDGFEQFVRDAIRVAIEESNPGKIFDLREALEKDGKAIAQAQIFAVESGVLADERNFTDARLGEIFRFADDRFETTAAEFSAELRDYAEGAGMVATFVDFDVSRVARSGDDTRREVVVKVSGKLGSGSGSVEPGADVTFAGF